MRLLFICPNLGAGGAERQWSILLPGLRRLGHEVRLIALDGGGPFVDVLARRGIRLDVVEMRHRADLGPLLRSRLLREFVPHAIVARGVSGLYVGAAVARWRRARLVFTDHRQVGFPLSRRHELMVRLIADRIDLVIAVTPAQCDGWRKRGYPAERVVVVPNGVEAHDVPQSKAAIRRVIGLSDDHVVATVVASMRPEKCIPDVVTALLRVHRTRPELIGVIVGDGPDRPSVVRAVGDTTAVRLLGHRDDVPRILKASDMLVLASRFEAVPMAILEAMAAGLPVIATDVGGVRDIVENGVTGFLVPATARGQLVSRLEQLVGDPALRGRMGRAGVCRYQEVGDAEAMVDRYARALADGAKRI